MSAAELSLSGNDIGLDAAQALAVALPHSSLRCLIIGQKGRKGIRLPVKKKIQLKEPVNLFNDLAKQYHIDCEVGSIEDDQRDPVSYFGKREGIGDAFLIAEYLGV